jgi:signal peptidase II
MISVVTSSAFIRGVIGNVYDRLVHGYVKDFLALYYQYGYWPSFNVASRTINIDTVLLIIDMFKKKEEKHG